ncbi:MAG: membrane protein insertion efficiency factor YidD [Waddliaceae bacterium]
MKTIALLLIRFYQYCLSPLIGETCRFHPSCSHYADEAIRKYGFFRGCWLAAKRLIKCNPWHPGGHDPLP